MANNLIQSVQSFMTPELIGKASTLTGDTPSRTKASLAGVIPTLLMGIAHLGSTQEGAGRVMDAIQEGGYDQGVPSNLTEQLSGGAASESYLLKGKELTSKIFGSKLDSVTSGIAGRGGDSEKSGKLLALFAPVALGVLGSHVKKSGMNASGLSSFLGEQKGSLKSLLPGGIGEHFTRDEYREPLREVPRPEVLPRTEVGYERGILADRPKRQRTSPWPVALLALLILGSLFLFKDHRGRELLPPTQEEANVNTRKPEAAAPQVAQPQGAQEPASAAGTKSGQQLAAILAPDSQVPLPQRIPLPDTKFDEGGTQLSAGSEGEINNVASVLRAHPTAQARVEGYGFRKEASRVCMAFIAAAPFFNYRLPEVFAGYARENTEFPVEYPTASSPQAWATGSVLLGLRVMLGLEAEEGSLRVAPELPKQLARLAILGVIGPRGRQDVHAVNEGAETRDEILKRWLGQRETAMKRRLAS